MMFVADVLARANKGLAATRDSLRKVDPVAWRWSQTICMVLALGLLVGYTSAVQAQSDPVTPCTSSISSCGCTITKKGSYTVTADLMASQGLTGRGDCIDIKAANASLDLKGFDVTGSGGGTAILVLKTANKSSVDSTSGVSTIGHWATGVQVSGNKVSLRNIDAESNSTGVLISKGNKCDVSDITADHNSTAGIVLKGVKNGSLSSFEADSNGSFGVWLQASNNLDDISNGDASDNGNTGIFLGCASGGPSGAKCGVPTSKNTSIKGNTADGNGNAGIALDLGDKKNDVSNNHSTGSGGPDDLVDENPSCDKNDWTNNSFGTANQSCIH